MKTKLTSLFKKSANTPPMWVCLLFALVISTNCWGTVVTAIGTGTVTLNCGNVTSTTGEETTTWTNASSSGACCLYMLGGDGTAKSYWDVTIQPGTYDIQLHYGTINYGITAKFDLLLASNNSQVMEIHNQPGYWTTPVNFYVTKEDVNLTSLNGSTTYRVQAANTYGGGGSHFVVEYIKFIRKDGCETPETASFVAGSGDVTGSVDDVEICAGAEFTMPSSGSMVYPGYLFTGWKLNNAGELITAGTSYTMPAGGASFTAQWEADNVSLRVPSVHPTLSASNYSRTTGSVVENGYDVDGDEGLDTYLNLQSKKYAEWDVYLEPGTYNITVKSCVDVYGIDVTYTLYDPAGVDATQTIHTYHQTGTGSTIRNVTTVTKDFSSLTENKRYVVKVEDTWDGGCHLRVKDITFTKLGVNYAISFAKGDESVTGSLPANTTCAEGGTYTLPALGNLARTGYKFTGWSDGSNTYAPGASYTMPSSAVTFTAQWQAVLVIDFEAEKSGNYDVALTWSIPGICDLSKATTASGKSDQYGGTNTTEEGQYYNSADSIVTAEGSSGSYGQYGVAFPIPNSTNVQSITVNWKCASDFSSKGVNLWAGTIAEDKKTYWEFNAFKQPTSYTKQTFNVDTKYWTDWKGDYSDFANTTIQYIGVFANAGNGGASGLSFSVKEVRYHVENQADIDHIVLMRKPNAVPNDTTDGTKIYSGTKSYFNDNAEKSAGTYYYAVFAVYNDVSHTISSAVVADPVVIESAKVDPELTINLNQGAISETGSAQLTVSTATTYTGELEYSVSPSGVISLNETTGEITAVAAGTATITVTAPATAAHYADNKSVTVTVIAAPTTNLAIDGVDGDNVTLKWTIPGIIDLTTVRTERSSDFVTDYGSSISNTTSSELLNNGAELAVTYSADGGGSYNGFFFDVDLTAIESISFDYKGENLGGGWKGILPGIFDGSTIYWESSKGLFGLSETTWTSETVAPSDNLWKSGTYSSGDISELCFLVYAEGDAVSNGHVYLRNLRYHSTGMTDIDHIVIRRTTSAPATSITDGDEIYNGKLSHIVDDDTKAEGLYYYTLFAVYENGSIPVESVILDTRVFNITYKDKGDTEFSGTHETGYPTTHSNAAATALKKATKENYAFVGWYDNAACTGDAVTSLAAGAYNADITLYARWEELSLHQPGKYQAPDGYGRVLKNVNGHDYEVYMVTFDTIEAVEHGALYAGPVAKISDGYKLFVVASDKDNTNTCTKGDGWTEFKPYKYYGSDGSCSIDEFTKLNSSSSIGSSRYARLGENYYVRLYVKGYASFALIGKESEGNSFVVKINGETQLYTANTSEHVARFTLASVDEPYFIEITGTGSTYNNFRGFSLQLPDVERYTVTVAKNDNSYGTVSAASIPNVRAGEATYVTENTVYIAGTTVTATPAENTAQYTYAFDNWSGVPATITAATTITANFTRTANDYTLTWDLNGGTVTTAGTGADVDATGTPSCSVAYGTAITAPVVEKDGYKFIGWDVTPAATMPAEAVTYTAQWATPTVIGSGTTTLDYSNVYLPTAPATYEMNVDGVEGDETCLDIKDQGQADWWVKMTPGSYRVAVKYGTPSGCVKVRVQVIDAETGAQVTQTEIDEHCSGTVFMAAWAMDLGELIDADKTYYIRVKDAYENTGSKPKVGIVEITPIEPLPITTAATKHLDYDNVAVPYQIMPFDIENDGVNETCLFIGDNHQADWKVTIVPDVYNIKIRYGKPSAGTNLTLYLLNEDGGEVWKSAARTTPSGRYETWEIKGVDLTNKVDKDNVYTIRIKDTYNGTGSKPYIGYIDFIPAVVRIPSETRLDATNTYSSVNIATDVDFDDDSQTSDESMNLNGTQADWSVQIQPGYYNVSLAYGAPEYSVKVAVTLTDPSGEKSEIYLSTNPYYSQSGSEGEPHHHISSTKCDLTDLDKNKTYRLHITDKYGSSNKLRVSHLAFTPIEPVLISNGTILNSGNTVTFNAPTQEFNVDGEDGNETCLLVSQHYGVSPVEWSVTVTPGVYDLSVPFGNDAPNDGGYDMTIYLVDPEAPETPVTLYHKRVSDGTSLSYGVARCDFSSLTADKDYIIRVVDNWDGSKLRVGDIKFVTPEPLQIPEVTRLNASNVYVLPKYGKQNFNIEGEGEIECLNIRYQGEAAWFANLTPFVYDITLKYGKPEASVKVLFGIIDVETGETVFSRQFDNSEEGAQTYTQNFTIDLRNDITAGKLYKLFIKDNYGSNGSEPRVAYIDIARYTITYTRTGLTVGNYGTICLPYAVAAEDIHGADIFDMQGWPAGSVAVVLNEVDNMVAGRPYVIQTKASTITFSYFPEGDPTDAGSHNGLIGSYTKEIIPANENNYMVYKNKLYYVDVLSYVGENKAYINRTEAEEAAEPVAPAPGKRQIRLFLNGEQVVTDMDQINDQMTNTKYMENGILYILREGKVYNAQGQLVK